MADIEKVIKGLECCMDATDKADTVICHCRDCTYKNDDIVGQRCLTELISDSLELLKEKEQFPAEIEGGGSTWWYVCGDCHGAIMLNDHYCKHCGRAVTWK